MGEPGSAQSALLFQGTDSIQWKRTGSDEDQRIPENRSYFLPTLGQRNGREPGAEIPSGYQTEAWKNLQRYALYGNDHYSYGKQSSIHISG